MLKYELIEDFENLKLAIQFEDLPEIIRQISIHKIQSRGLEEFTRGLLIGNIKQYIIYNNLEELKINRNNEYGDPTFDCYRIEAGKLIRNGSSARHTSLGKLYTAYKKIYKLD